MIKNDSRRKFIKTAFLTTLSLMLTSHSNAQTSTLKNQTIIIIGAGFSGLAAASALVNVGAKVKVIEAKPKVGGRVSTDWSMGAPFELGAGWIHGPETANPIRKLADLVNANLKITDDDSFALFNTKAEQLTASAINKLDNKWVKVLQKIDNALEDNDKRSLAVILKKQLTNDDFEWAMSAYTEFSIGGPLESISATLYDEGKEFKTADVLITNGFDQLLKPLTTNLDILLSTQVTAINYSKTGTTVNTNKGEFSADYVVCSVPLGVLKANTIKFIPRLPASYINHISKIGFGSVTKIAFKFEHAFWDVNTQYFGMMTQPRGRWNYWMNYRTFSEQNILLGLSVGAYAPIADTLSDSQIQEDALNVLKEIWGDAVTEPLSMLRTNWSTDPFCLGAYAYPTASVLPHQFDALSHPIKQRLLLCGEHTLYDYAGTTHGAYLSGLRAAKYVIRNSQT